ncbi:hypothetical protein I4U23_004202 [Adineta vaga]|nr:hypothetical protein I4U23_004202 [Adineta vaga]
MVSFNIQTLLGDLYEQNFNTSRCIFMGYLMIICLCALYCSFVNQAFFRLCRIVYTKYKWLQNVWFYTILFPIEFILICIVFSPLMFWHDIIYLSREYYCSFYFTNTRSTLWLLFYIYVIPLLNLSLIYLRIFVFLRQQPTNQSFIVKQRQKRDLVVIKRILIITSLLVILGAPGLIILLMFYITGIEHPLFYRIEWFSINLSVCAISFVMVIFTSQLKSMIWKRFQHNQIVPQGGILVESIQRRRHDVILPYNEREQ